MTQPSLDALCHLAGITTDYATPVPDATKRQLLEALGIDPANPQPKPPGPMAVPEGAACFLPDWLLDAPAWGLFCQLYELRSDRSWGIGDFRDLADLARIAADAGADFLGINPVHALFLAAPERCSPFAPSNRQFLNPLYIAMDDLPGKPGTRAALATVQAAERVDYAAVGRLKRAGLRGVFDRKPFDRDRFTQADFAAFCQAGGSALHHHALFETLSAQMVETGHGPDWTDWPGAFRSVDSPQVAQFARTHADQLQFQLWLQWIAARQLTAVQKAALAAGMRIGIYLDLAVGEAPGGSATWGNPGLTLPGLTIGAPPDVFAQEGQNWNLSAPSPKALADRNHAAFRTLIEAQMRHAGALRIDHAMALWQLFLIPEGKAATQGTHLRYPFAGLIRTLAEASQRQGAIVIGEDLGWVPPGFREAMHAAQLLSYRILYFEQEGGLFRRTGTYPETALACISTHDLPTLSGWWQNEDIDLRAHFGLIDRQSAAADADRRRDERRALVAALEDGGQLPPGGADTEQAELPAQVLTAAHRFLAETPCLLVGVRLADLAGPDVATNVPGTCNEYPNWQARSPTPLSQLADLPAFREVTQVMRTARPKPDRAS